MVINLKFARFESAPWGFRLIGGSDFDVPLTVVKVAEGSLAEQAGLRVGDIIVRINDEPTSWMTHNDAHDYIMKAGNTFFFGVMRPQEDSENEQFENEQQQHQYLEISSDKRSPSIGRATSEISIEEERPQSIERPSSADTEEKQETEIADLMSGEAEVLKDHNVIGIFPKPGVCMSSQVLRSLNDEAVKTQKEREEEKRKWTTFLQKPDRPIPKSKKELEAEAKRIPYKVNIVRQPKPRVAPDRPPSPPPPLPVIEPEPEPEPEPIQIEEEEASIPTDSEIPDLQVQSEVIEAQQQEATEVHASETHSEEFHETTIIESSSETIEQKVEIKQKTEEEIALEKQLAEVQKQLLALSSLPSTIQATLDAVTKQLAELVPTFRLEQPSQTSTNQIQETKIEIDPEAAQRDKETGEIIKICMERISKLSERKILEIPNFPPPPTPEQLEMKRQEQQQAQLQNELAYKKQKENDLISELEQKQRSIREKPQRKSNRAFGPLTPQERPLVLPGGRRWRKPKDAYNDEFIAEVLSSQAELITGTTLGRNSESSHLGCKERHYSFISLNQGPLKSVNFKKYQKPEKKIDLEKSEVYRVVHHLEREPIRGIEVRPPKVLAEADIRKCSTPISCT